MAEKKQENVFTRAINRIVRRFVEVRQEMKRVIWPTKAKLLQVAVVVLAVIVAAAILLSLISKGGGFVLDKLGFYNQVAETTVTTAAEVVPTETTIAAVSETTAAVAVTTAA